MSMSVRNAERISLPRNGLSIGRAIASGIIGHARPAAIGLRIRFTCRRERRRTHHRGPNGRFRRISCHCCISDYRAGRGLLGLAPSLTFTCPPAPAAWRFWPRLAEHRGAKRKGPWHDMGDVTKGLARCVCVEPSCQNHALEILSAG